MVSTATRPAKRRPMVAVPTAPLMAEPTATQHPVQYLPLASIDIVRNTRQSYDEPAMAELVASIAAQGVLQNIVVRPHPQQPGRYQLAAGHRRYLASGQAGRSEIPASIRPLTDREFLEVQLLENLQRQDVHPADEAVTFAEMLDQHGYSAEEIGARVGKSARFVAQRARLATLLPFWLTALQEGRLPVQAANELARLPQAGQQIVQTVAQQDYDRRRADALFSFQWISQNVKHHVLRELNAAAFPKGDATLYPMAGACTTCPKRSGAFKQLFDEEEQKHDLCLDGVCFGKKKDLFVERRKKELRAETGEKPLLVSTKYYRDSDVAKDALIDNQYRKVKPETPGAVQALVLDGTEAGQTTWVQLNDSPQAKAGVKADRSAEIRSEKISEKSRQLLAGELFKKALSSGLVLERHLDDCIFGELRSQGGPHIPLRFALVEHCSFSMPEGGELALRKLTPAANHEGLRAWERENVALLTYTEKLALYFALLGYNCSTYDSSNKRLLQYAAAAGADTAAVQLKAGQLVDKTYVKPLVEMSEAELDLKLAETVASMDGRKEVASV